MSWFADIKSLFGDDKYISMENCCEKEMQNNCEMEQLGINVITIREYQNKKKAFDVHVVRAHQCSLFYSIFYLFDQVNDSTT